MLANILKPFSCPFERFITGYVVGEENDVCTAVENTGYTLERFLACCVPDLEFTLFAIQNPSESSKFDSDRNLMFISEFVVVHSFHYARFTYCHIPNDNDFEKMVLRFETLSIVYNLERLLQ